MHHAVAAPELLHRLRSVEVATLRERYHAWKAFQAERARVIARYQTGAISADSKEITQLEERFQRLAAGRPRWLAMQEESLLRKALVRAGDREAIEDELKTRRSVEKWWETLTGHRGARARFELYVPMSLQMRRRCAWQDRTLRGRVAAETHPRRRGRRTSGRRTSRRVPGRQSDDLPDHDEHLAPRAA